jgi:GAF domain-containing protein/HAMP domain-containing protein
MSDQILQNVAWFLALAQFILALYVFLFNAWHTANRHVSALLFLTALNAFALGVLTGIENASQTAWPTAMLALTSFAIRPLTLITCVVLLHPDWPRGYIPDLQKLIKAMRSNAGAAERTADVVLPKGRHRWRPIWWVLNVLFVLPALLLLLDVGLDAGLWYTGLEAEGYAGGYVHVDRFTAGPLYWPLKAIYHYLIPVLTLIFLSFVAFVDKRAAALNRRFIGWLAVPPIIYVVLSVGVHRWLGHDLSALIINASLGMLYGYVGVKQMVSERRVQRGRLQTRLTVLMLGITVPLVAGVVAMVSTRAADLVTQSAAEKLSATNQALASNVQVWLDLNAKALQQLVSLPDIVSMEPERQEPFLEAMAAAYPHMYLVGTTDRDGMNVARSDDQSLQDYGDRLWQIGARNGSLTFEVVASSRTTGEPALVVSAPIKRELGTIVGVGMFASHVTDIAQAVQASTVGETGFAYVVDGQNRVVAHPDEEIAAELQDFTFYPAVFELRGGESGAISFTDEYGQRWRAHGSVLDNNWGIIVQQQESDFMSGLTRLNQATWIVTIMGAALLSSLAGLSIRQTFRPIERLTETATAISTGDLTRTAPVESEDEIGILARAFNSMTEQLRVLIGSLELQVSERTQDLERRSAYLEASAEVSRAAASILDTEDLMRQVVDQIREQFDLYYVGLFLVERASSDQTAGQWAVLRAGTGQAGQAMLARGHRLKVGEGSMIGWCIANAAPRVALQAELDQVRAVTAELPDTRSELAIPLRSRGQVLGALSVQDTQPHAFDEVAIAALQTMADQVAVALENARLFAENQAALEASRKAYGEMSREAWAELLRTRSEWTVVSDSRGETLTKGVWRPEMTRAAQEGRVVTGDLDSSVETGALRSGYPLAVPVKVRGDVVGVLDTFKPQEEGDWTEEELETLQEIADQLAQTLDSARLYQDTQLRAAREQLAAEIATHMRETLDIETVLKITADEVYQALDLDELTICLSSGAAVGQGLATQQDE